jgi:phosphate-selective porin OprO and OprP
LIDAFSRRVLATAMLMVSLSASAAAQQSQSTTSSQKPKPADDTPKFRWQNHPSLDLGKGTRIDFRARLQGDLRQSDAPSDNGDTPALDLARRRVGVAGEIANTVDFQVEAEIASDELWRDVYANYRQFDTIQVQVGKFKLPFGLEENTSSTNLDFAYRSMTSTRLAPGRDRGLMVQGRVLARVLRYEAGVFDHDGRNARANDPEKVIGGRTVAGRLTAQPFRNRKSPMADFQIGIAHTASEMPEGITGLRARTVFGSSFFSPDLWVKGRRRRLGVEARVRPGPASLKAEFIRVTTDRQGQSTEDADLSAVVASGWYVSGTYALTGEKKAAGLDVPRRPLFRGGIGAVELAARIEKLTFGTIDGGDEASKSPRADIVLGNANRATTFGVNWYLNRWIKIQGNMIQETITDPAEGPFPSRRSFWSRVLRFQFSL